MGWIHGAVEDLDCVGGMSSFLWVKDIFPGLKCVLSLLLGPALLPVAFLRHDVAVLKHMQQ